MKILILGGTGAMGAYLAPLLAQKGHDVFVTTRSNRQSDITNIHFMQGNAHDWSYVNNILKPRYDAIIDFMSYDTEEFRERYNLFLNATGQYIFLSSSRVYADSKLPITEESPRLLDTVDDREYLQTDEYALSKARQENMLIESGKDNWTIVRPYITYSNERLQLGIYEKELWLHRVLQGQTVVFPRGMAEHITTLTYGEDVASGIAALVGNHQAYGHTVHITTAETIRWVDVIELYQKVYFDVTGKQMKVKYIDSAQQLRNDLFNQYQIKYDRMLDREFDNSKIMRLSGKGLYFISPKEGLEKCLRDFLKKPSFRYSPTVKMTAWMDLAAKEKTQLKDFSDWKSRTKYIIGRYSPYFKLTQNRN